MSAGNAQAPTSDGAGVAGAPDAPDTGAWPESDERRTQRFTIELEFVQCLAHPMYLSYLAQHPKKLLNDAAFVGYLEYLQYWRSSEYARFIRYPQCLYFLELLQNKAFRDRLSDPWFIKLLWDTQVFHWRHHFRNRSKAMPAV